MNYCLSCGKPIRNKYCNVGCQNSHQNVKRLDKRLGEYKNFIVNCEICNKEIDVLEREKKFPSKNKYYCSRSCANNRGKRSEETKKKISESLKITRKRDPYIKECLFCKKNFKTKKKIQKLCSRSCSSSYSNFKYNTGRKGGLASAQKSVKRSKNEIYFANLCKTQFKNVLTNQNIFNGWDADVILPDFKIAILWNGKWHYEKIKEAHSVKQVQNRDKIKIKEIKKLGYTPYIIKDMGKHNVSFVEKEFEILLNILRGGVNG